MKAGNDEKDESKNITHTFIYNYFDKQTTDEIQSNGELEIPGIDNPHPQIWM